ncbi:MAG: hypothetical protein WD342_20775 [Verrucomicrobiales bacterium]
MGQFEKLSSHNNEIGLWENGASRCIVKAYRGKPLTLKRIKYSAMHLLGMNVPIEYRPARCRREFERKCLRFWATRGFLVPEEVPHPAGHSERGVSLAMSFLDGITLDAYLRDETRSPQDKWDVLDTVFQDLRDRHLLAISDEDYRLIHFDSNMRNIIVTEDGPARVDFEMGRPRERIDRSAQREVKKLVLEIANALGEESLVELIARLYSHYGILEVINGMANAELDRRFPGVHRIRDARRKRRRPGLVTKLDLARAVRDKATQGNPPDVNPAHDPKSPKQNGKSTGDIHE